MGTLCSKQLSQDAEISKRIANETKSESRVEKLLLLGAGESGKSTIFKQIRVLFHTRFDESELKNYIPVIHANIYQSIKILHDASKEFKETEEESSSKYVLQPENQEVGEKIFEIGSSSEFPTLTLELALDIIRLWNDPAIQATFLRANELQLPDCTQYFLDNVARVAQPNYIPTEEDVLYARVRTTGIVEMEFSPIGVSNRKEVYKLLDVGGQRNERRKWIHLFDGVTAVIFCAALSEYDQTLFEDDKKNRMMETKELFDRILKEPGFEKTSFLLFLNKFDIFEKKAQRVPLNVCEWFRDYMPSTTGQHEIDHAYEFVKKKFEEVYKQNNPPNSVNRVFEIYKTTAVDQTLVRRTFDLVDKALTLKRLRDARLL